MFRNAQNVKNIILACKKRINIIHKLNPILFDVSLRDGIQNANIENFPLSAKIDIFHSIIYANLVENIEIGALVSSKIMPIMSDSLVLFTQINNSIEHIKSCLESSRELDETPNIKIPKIYLLIPSIDKMRIAFSHNIRNFSFITSVSNKFQLSNTKKSLYETKHDFEEMFRLIYQEPGYKIYKTKLYISCVNHCPIIGKIDNNIVINEILYYHSNYTFDELCLSDTVGKLDLTDLKIIIDNCLANGIPASKFSLHLHVSKHNIENIEQILFYLFSKNINKFDVSCLETGGCTVTMQNDLCTNLTYDMFFDILLKYVNKQITSDGF